MKRNILSIVFVSFMGCLPGILKAQQPDSLYQNRIQFVSKELLIKEETAKSVIGILDSFKTKAQLVLRENDGDEITRKTRINELMEERNQQLSKILKPAQMERFIKENSINPKQRPPVQ